MFFYEATNCVIITVMVNNDHYLIRVRLGWCWFRQLYGVKLVLEAACTGYFLKFKYQFKGFDRCGGSFHIQGASVFTFPRGGRVAGLCSSFCSPGAEQEPHKHAQGSYIIHQHMSVGALANNNACKHWHVEHGGAIMIWLFRQCFRCQNLLQLSTAGWLWQPSISGRGYTGSTRG